MNGNNILSPPIKKRKSRNDLSNESKYTTPSIRTGSGYLEGVRARSDSKATHIICHKRAKHAVELAWSPIASNEQFDVKSSDDNDYEAENDFQKMGPGVRALRAKAIEFLFVHIYNSPPKIEWRQLNLPCR
jgi:hypothetical protein